MIKYFLISLGFIYQSSSAQSVKILFDATKAETAGNADWVIDADLHNLGWNPNAQVNNGNESNAQKVPSPAQNNVTSSTPETYYEGALSNWGIDCIKQGYQVETLPYNGSITYNMTSNPQDLSNYKVFIICEPNIQFTASEKNAILNFVQNGGGLFMVSDHDQSDRNGDGWDSPAIWNDLMSANPFGITFNLDNYSQTSTSVITSLNDSIANGPFGHVTKVQWSGGTDMTISNAINNTVKGVAFKNGMLNNNSKVMMAYARYGNGKIAAIGDSSPCDDGSGDPNDVLYNGYILDANGNHQKLLMNATIWLATANTGTTGINDQDSKNNSAIIFYSDNQLNIKSDEFQFNYIQLFNASGLMVYSKKNPEHLNTQTIQLDQIEKGFYIVKLTDIHNKSIFSRVIVMH